MLKYDQISRYIRLGMLEDAFWCCYNVHHHQMVIGELNKCMEWHMAMDQNVGPQWGFFNVQNEAYRGPHKFVYLQPDEMINPPAVSDYLFGSVRDGEAQAAGVYVHSGDWTLALCRIAFLHYMDSQSASDSNNFEAMMRSPGTGPSNPLISTAMNLGDTLIRYANTMYRNIKSRSARMHFDHTTQAKP